MASAKSPFADRENLSGIYPVHNVRYLSGSDPLGPPPLAPEVVKAAAEILGRKEMAALGLEEPEQASREVCADK